MSDADKTTNSHCQPDARQTIDAQGQCLCGKVSISATLNTELGACHCSMCRQWGGGPFLALTPAGASKIRGEANIQRFQSSDWAERGFCTNCGTHLFYHLLGSEHYVYPAGLFTVSEVAFDHQIFIDEKPAYYDFSNTTKNMTGAEVFAQFNSSK